MKRLIVIILSIVLCNFEIFAINYSLNSLGLSIEWQKSDINGIYTISGTRIKMSVKDIPSDRHYVTMSGGGWGLNPNTLYYSYYPYNPDYVNNKRPITALPISYNGQKQDTNASTAHLSAFDYMTSQATTGAEDVTFNFNHLGCVARFAIYIAKTETFTSLTLSTEEGKEFTTEATMNITNNNVTTTTAEQSIPLALNNITVEEGDSLIAYMMLSPADYKDTKLTLTFKTAEGQTATAMVNGTTMLPGMFYPVSLQHLSYTSEDEEQQETSAKAMPIYSEEIVPEATEANVIAYPKGYAPDFLKDTKNIMTEFQEQLIGDANNDGTVTMADANLVVNNYLGNETPDICFINADVNKDGKLTMADANAIVNIYLGQ